MVQRNPDSAQQTLGGTIFSYVQENWNDLEGLERFGFAVLIVLVATKNKVQRKIKAVMWSIIRGR